MESIRPVILYDGICNLCNASVRFIKRRKHKDKFIFIPFQSEEGERLRKKFNFTSDMDSVILIEQEEYFIESDAVLRSCAHLSFPWNTFTLLRFIPGRWRNGIYKWIAGNRYRWFGKSEVCNVDFNS